MKQNTRGKYKKIEDKRMKAKIPEINAFYED